jgi:hypothetical protein
MLSRFGAETEFSIGSSAQGGSDPERSTVRALDLGPGVAEAIVLVIGREEDQARWHAM